jgi:hypothetical protein
MNTTSGNIPNPFSLIATTPVVTKSLTTTQVDMLKNKDTAVTGEDDKLNEFRRQLQEQRE